jgi:hypothetical protein
MEALVHEEVSGCERAAGWTELRAKAGQGDAEAQGYRDSGTVCDRVSPAISRAEVDEGNRRASAFVARKPVSLQTP